jgi:hypothetical protein
MASTYSNLKIELIGTGDQSGTWGNTTNINLGTAIEEAITGSADVNFATDADVTITLTSTNTAQTARNLRLNITESSTGIGSVRNLILGSGCQIEKLYLINNTGTGAKTVKNTTGTGIVVPAGKSMFVYNDGTNVVDATTHLSSLTLGSALSATSGGTGQSSYAVGDLIYASTTTALSKLADVATGNALISGGVGVAPAYGKIGLTTHVSGTLPIANGGTGSTSTTYCSLTTNVTGTLPVANGGTGTATQTAYSVLCGGTTSTGAYQSVASLGTAGQVLTSNGAGALPTWTSASSGTVTSVSWTGGIVSVATSTTTPAFTIAGTSGGIPYFSSGTTWASSGVLAASALVIGGGAGVAPSTTTTGTGVVTALGIAVNSGSGGLVTNTGTATLTNKTLTTPIISSISNTGTLTLPTSTDTLVGRATTDTLTNKRITPRVTSITGAAGGTITPTGDTADQYNITALGASATFAIPSGTPTDGQKLSIRIEDNGTGRALTWTTSAGGYRVIGTTLPTTTTASKTIYVGCIYNSADSFWDVVAVATQA